MSSGIFTDLINVDVNVEKVTKFGSICFNIKNVVNVESRRGQNPPPPGLNRVNNPTQQDPSHLRSYDPTRDAAPGSQMGMQDPKWESRIPAGNAGSQIPDRTHPTWDPAFSPGILQSHLVSCIPICHPAFPSVILPSLLVSCDCI